MVPSVFHQYLIETAILLLVVEMQYSNIGVVSPAYSGKYILHRFGKSSGSISQRELLIADTEVKLLLLSASESSGTFCDPENGTVSSSNHSGAKLILTCCFCLKKTKE